MHLGAETSVHTSAKHARAILGRRAQFVREQVDALDHNIAALEARPALAAEGAADSSVRLSCPPHGCCAPREGPTLRTRCQARCGVLHFPGSLHNALGLVLSQAQQSRELLRGWQGLAASMLCQLLSCVANGVVLPFSRLSKVRGCVSPSRTAHTPLPACRSRCGKSRRSTTRRCTAPWTRPWCPQVRRRSGSALGRPATTQRPPQSTPICARFASLPLPPPRPRAPLRRPWTPRLQP